MADGSRFLGRRSKEAEPHAVYDDYDDYNTTAWAMKLDAFAPTASTAASQAATATAEETSTRSRGPRLEDNLEQLIDFDGAIAVALVDSETGMILGRAGEDSPELELAAAGASVMLRARRSTIKTLGLSDAIDDLLVTLSTQLQIIRPLAQSPTVFLYLIVDRAKSSLALARFKSTEAAGKIAL